MKKTEIEITEEHRDKTNMVIMAGTRALIETELQNPMTNKKELILLIDNGTGDPTLYPKSLVVEEDLKYRVIDYRVIK